VDSNDKNYIKCSDSGTLYRLYKEKPAVGIQLPALNIYKEINPLKTKQDLVQVLPGQLS
jgi:hypothetical protein